MNNSIITLFIINNEYTRSLDAKQKVIELCERKYTNIKIVDSLPADIVFAIGGDRTILNSIHLIQKFPDIAFTGINTGNVGFLQPAEVIDLEKLLECISNETCQISYRSTLNVKFVYKINPNIMQEFNYVGLNEFRITGKNDSLIYFQQYIDEDLTHADKELKASGVIVSTASGSTGISESNGGPIVAQKGIDLLISTLMIPAIDKEHYKFFKNALLSNNFRYTFSKRYMDKVQFFIDSTIIKSEDISKLEYVTVNLGKKVKFLYISEVPVISHLVKKRFG